MVLWANRRRKLPMPPYSLVVARLVVLLVVAVVVVGSRSRSRRPWVDAAWAPVRPPRRGAPPTNVKILILPGFFNDASDYYSTAHISPSSSSSSSLVQSLQNRGWTAEQIRVLPVQRLDWLQVFWRGALDIQFWQGVAPPTRPAFAWYLQRVAQTIQEMTKNNNNNNNNNHPTNTEQNYQVLLLCHSAGGWLARAVLGYLTTSVAGDDDPADSNTAPTSLTLDQVCGVVTLGAPHEPPPDTVMDMTRGALKQTCQNFPGAYHQKDLFYVTVIGNAVQGVPPARRSSNPFEPPQQRTTSPSEFAYNSYQAVCGDGTTVGDGVVPICAAHLEGALQLTLEGVFHSINVPDQWYGADAVVDLWHEPVLQQIRQQQQQQKRQQSAASDNSNSNNTWSSFAAGTFPNPLASIFRR